MPGSKIAAKIAKEEKQEAEAMKEFERSMKHKKERTSGEAQSIMQVNYNIERK